MNKFDVIVVGGGHAGLEATFACANLGLSTALFSLNERYIADAPCNPSIGGPAKGVVTKEIDALGGMQGLATQAAQLQIKKLNESKGAGVWALRAQIDKTKYHEWFLQKLYQHPHIKVLYQQVAKLIIEKNQIKGIIDAKGNEYFAQAVVLTTGTYLASVCHIGKNQYLTGPNKQERAIYLSQSLIDHGFKLIRLKTGTPPRILKSSIEFNLLEKQYGSAKPLSFVHYRPVYMPLEEQCLCHLTYTNAKTHEIIRNNLSKSAMYGGQIHSIGPRYCPSIEDKVIKFSDKPRHQLFIEPETKDGDSMYLQGLSTSFDHATQEEIVHSIVGLQKAIFLRHAYAIEYDAIDPTQLTKTLESKKVKNLFFAGQINGTSGYEEAAGQGLLAGINAAADILNKPNIVLARHEAYLGVLVDDITTKGITEPYRLLTSRAEHRLYLRDDNCQDRLINYGHGIGLVKEEVYQYYCQQKKQIQDLIFHVKNNNISKYPALQKKYQCDGKYKIEKLIKRPEVDCGDVLRTIFPDLRLDQSIIDKVEIELRFEGYIKRQIKAIKQISHYPNLDLTSITDYHAVPNLSLEAIDKLNRIKPCDINQAKNISGINLVDLVAIKYYLDSTKR